MNIVFGENSFLKADNGADMIWNPSNRAFTNGSFGDPIYGGHHHTYILSSKYDGDSSLLFGLTDFSSNINIQAPFKLFMWAGVPLVNAGFKLLPLKDGLIPNETRLRFRVTRPYKNYSPTYADTINRGNPIYTFSTNGLAAQSLADASNPYDNNKQALLNQIYAVPNPYYGYAGYELNRLDTRVRIINLPQKATVNIYSLDGTLVRTLTKDNANQAFIDWDIRNAKGLPVASGMYLMHVNAQGIGETVVRWFGAMRPVDINTY